MQKKTKMRNKLLCAAAATALSINFGQALAADPSKANINQASLCMVENWRPTAVALKCTPDQKVLYLPDRWGNEQLPIIFAAGNCDLRYSVALTKGAVTCIYRLSLMEPEHNADKPDSVPESKGD